MFNEQAMQTMQSKGGQLLPSDAEIPDGYVVEAVDESTGIQIIVPAEKEKLPSIRGPQPVY